MKKITILWHETEKMISSNIVEIYKKSFGGGLQPLEDFLKTAPRNKKLIVEIIEK